MQNGQSNRGMRVRMATTDEERRRVYQRRYEVYIAELGRPYAADHERRELVDDLDDSSVHYYIAEHGEVVAAMRSHWGDPTPAVLEAFCASDAILAPHQPLHHSSRLFVAATGRASLAAWQLAKAAYLHGRSCGITHTYLYCAAHLVTMYERLGYERYRAEFTHPVVGQQFPLRLFADDEARLHDKRSPFAPLAVAYRNRDAWQTALDETFDTSAIPLTGEWPVNTSARVRVGAGEPCGPRGAHTDRNQETQQ